MNRFLPFFALSIQLLVASCSTQNEKVNTSSEASLQSKIKDLEFEISSEKSIHGLKISEINLDTTQYHDGTKGILISFNLQVKPDAFEVLKAESYTGYFVDIKCSSSDKTCLHRDELFKNPEKKKYIHTNKDCFISAPGSREYSITFPYRIMEMKEGDKEIEISIDAFPTRFDDEASSLNMKMLNSIATTSKASTTLKLKVKAPKLYKAMFTVHKLKINTNKVKVDRFDVGAQRLPDIFWEIYCGNDYIYYSPVEKNKIEYTKKFSTPTFYCTLKDTINLALMDYDNGPFNTQDEKIAQWKILASQFMNKKDTIRLDNFEYLILESKMEEVN